jgi:L-threonylcarbamoyladenylate synthase
MVVPADSPRAFDLLWDCLAGRGVAVVACDTIYGLVGIVPDTADRIRGIKGRGDDKPFLQLVPSAVWVESLASAAMPPALGRYWPGPLTVILPAKSGGTVALRVPDSPFLRRLIEAVGKPIYSTSVNTAGQQPLWQVARIVEEFASRVDLVLDAGDLPGGSPSTIVDATTVPARVIRQGGLSIPAADLL